MSHLKRASSFILEKVNTTFDKSLQVDLSSTTLSQQDVQLDTIHDNIPINIALHLLWFQLCLVWQQKLVMDVEPSIFREPWPSCALMYNHSSISYSTYDFKTGPHVIHDMGKLHINFGLSAACQS